MLWIVQAWGFFQVNSGWNYWRGQPITLVSVFDSFQESNVWNIQTKSLICQLLPAYFKYRFKEEPEGCSRKKIWKIILYIYSFNQGKAALLSHNFSNIEHFNLKKRIHDYRFKNKKNTSVSVLGTMDYHVWIYRWQSWQCIHVKRQHTLDIDIDSFSPKCKYMDVIIQFFIF